jgi:hypothetical protein
VQLTSRHEDYVVNPVASSLRSVVRPLSFTRILAIAFILMSGLCCGVQPVSGLGFGPQLPPVLHECDVNCNTLRLENGHYVLMTRYPWDRFPGPIIWTVEEFSAHAFKLHRTYPANQVFAGEIAPDGAHLINVTINGTPSTGLHIAWGNALSSVYGNNGERDAAGSPQAADRRPSCHPDSPSVGAQSTADPTAVVMALVPKALHICDANCKTLQFREAGLVYLDMAYWVDYGTFGSSPYQWAILSFNPGCVKIRRNSPTAQGILEGKIGADGHTLTDTSVDGVPQVVQVAWGPAINTVYGSNAERDAPLIEARRQQAIAQRSPEDNRIIQIIWNAYQTRSCPANDIDPVSRAPRWILNQQRANELSSDEMKAYMQISWQCFLTPQNAAEAEQLRKINQQSDEWQSEWRDQCKQNAAQYHRDDSSCG